MNQLVNIIKMSDKYLDFVKIAGISFHLRKASGHLLETAYHNNFWIFFV